MIITIKEKIKASHFINRGEKIYSNVQLPVLLQAANLFFKLLLIKQQDYTVKPKIVCVTHLCWWDLTEGICHTKSFLKLPAGYLRHPCFSHQKYFNIIVNLCKCRKLISNYCFTDKCLTKGNSNLLCPIRKSNCSLNLQLVLLASVATTAIKCLR